MRAASGGIISVVDDTGARPCSGEGEDLSSGEGEDLSPGEDLSSGEDRARRGTGGLA